MKPKKRQRCLFHLTRMRRREYFAAFFMIIFSMRKALENMNVRSKMK